MRAATMALVLAAALFGAPAARAGGSAGDEARTYFEAGATAYEAGQYLAAVQAFEHAYELSKREGIIFSIGQAYRKQYYLDRRPESLARAIEKYREYLKQAPEGRRKGDAAAAVVELEALTVASGKPAASSAAPAPLPAVEAATYLMVSSRTKGATISVDGGKPRSLPLTAEVEPGKHRIRVSAEGYFAEESELDIPKGSAPALQIPLRPRPAELTVKGAEGAEISIDGRVIGEAPLARPLALAAGSHLVAVLRNGHRGYSEELVLARGERRELGVELRQSAQRIASYVLVSVGAAGVCAGGAFTGLALWQERRATEIHDQIGQQAVPSASMESYNTALERRDRWRTAAAIALGSGAAVGVTGLLLYGFDQPTAEAPLRRAEPKATEPEEAAPGAAPDEIALAPVWLPGGGMALLGVKF